MGKVGETTTQGDSRIGHCSKTGIVEKNPESTRHRRHFGRGSSQTICVTADTLAAASSVSDRIRIKIIRISFQRMSRMIAKPCERPGLPAMTHFVRRRLVDAP